MVEYLKAQKKAASLDKKEHLSLLMLFLVAHYFVMYD